MRLRVAWPELKGRKLRRWLLVAVLIAWGGVAYWHTHKPLLAGTHVNGPAVEVPADAIQLVADITAADAYGRPVLSQAIFDEVLSVVRSARQFLVLDYFLFNHQGGAIRQRARRCDPCLKSCAMRCSNADGSSRACMCC